MIAQGRLDLALQMPTIPEYVIGVSRRIGGYNALQVNKMWDWTKTYDENNAVGSIPSGDMIWWVRFLPSLLSILSIVITFYLIRQAFGVRTGYIWMVLTLANNWLISTLQRAMGESPLLFCIVIAMLAGSLAIKNFNDDAKSIKASLFWIVIFGVCTGLAGQSKLNGLAIFPSGIAILVLLTLSSNSLLRRKFLVVGLIGLSAFAFIFFIGPNPFLWSDPIGRTIQTLQFRVNMMNDSQSEQFPEIAIKDWRDAIKINAEEIFSNHTPIFFTNSNYLKMLLALIGISVLISISWSSYLKMYLSVNASAWSILLVGFCASVPNLFTPLNIDRYFILPVYFVSILIAIGLDWILKYLRQFELREVV